MKKKILLLLICIIVICSGSYYYQYISRKSLTQIPILMYHNFDEKNIGEAVISPENFRKQLEFLKKEGYESITINDYIEFVENKKNLPEKPILITMDDGYLSNYTVAYPILKEEDMKATIFVITKSVGKEPGSNPHFTWEQAREMYDSGCIDIQSHSYDSHYKVDGWISDKGALARRIKNDVKKETKEDYEERIKEDLLKSKEEIEKHVGNKVYALAYPYGEYSKTSEKIAKKLGYKSTLIIKNKMNYENASPYLLKRIQISGYDSEEDLLEKLEDSPNISKTFNKIRLKAISVINKILSSKKDSNKPINIYVNEKEINFSNQSPYVDKNNNILVPIKDMAEALNVQYNYNPNDKSALIIYNDKKIKFVINQNKVFVNDEEKQIDSVPILTPKKEVLIPIRILTQVLGRNIEWVGEENAIYIY